jgi:hypothetical protein
MPVLPSCITEPLWDQFAALLPDRVDPHPLGCHRRRIPDRTVFEHILAALVHGSGTSASPAPGCSDRTTRHRVKAWAKLGDLSRGPCLALAAYDRMIGLGWTSCRWTAASPRHPAAGSGRAAPRSTAANRAPTLDRRRRVRRSAWDRCRQANRHDSPLLGPTLQAATLQVGALPRQANVHLDRGYDSAVTRALLGGGAHSLVDERLWQATALHRKHGMVVTSTSTLPPRSSRCGC